MGIPEGEIQSVMKVFIDTNIILDVLQERNEFLKDSLSVLQMGKDGSISLYASPLTFATCHYILQKNYDKMFAIQSLRTIKSFIEITTMDDEQCFRALYSDMPDFEDLLQFESATAYGCDSIVTRNGKHFPKEPLSILTPTEFMNLYTE